MYIVCHRTSKAVQLVIDNILYGDPEVDLLGSFVIWYQLPASLK